MLNDNLIGRVGEENIIMDNENEKQKQLTEETKTTTQQRKNISNLKVAFFKMGFFTANKNHRFKDSVRDITTTLIKEKFLQEPKQETQQHYATFPGVCGF